MQIAILSLLFLIVSIIKLRAHMVEHFWTRFIAALWFALTSLVSVDPELSHDVSISVMMIILVIEIVSPVSRWYWRNKK